MERLNGKKAYNLFEKYFKNIAIDHCISYKVMPSTSPANARYNFDDLVEKGMLRELHEEVIIKGDFSYEFLGLINSNNAEVSLVHTGLCYLVKVKDYDCAVNETKKYLNLFICFS